MGLGPPARSADTLTRSPPLDPFVGASSLAFGIDSDEMYDS
jgi:hypothetical protein